MYKRYFVGVSFSFLTILGHPALAGVEKIFCQTTDEKGVSTEVRLLQSGHSSNQYHVNVNGFKIAIHQNGFFGDSGMLPDVQFKIERPEMKIALSAFGHAQLFPDGKGIVTGPQLSIGSEKISVHCSSLTAD